MDREALSTKIVGRHMPDEYQIVVDIRKPASPDEVREVIESLREYGPKELSITRKDGVLIVDKLTDEVYDYFRTFGSTNYLLARTRAGDFEEHDSGADVASLRNGLHFVTGQRIGYEQVKRHFSKRKGGDSWKEGRAKCIAKSSKEGGKLSISFDCDGYVIVDNRFGGAYKEVSALGFPDLSQYLLQAHLEELRKAGIEAANKGYAKTLESIGSNIIRYGTGGSATSDDGKTHIVFSSTNLNPFTAVVGMERRLYRALGKEVALDYNDEIYISKEQ